MDEAQETGKRKGSGTKASELDGLEKVALRGHGGDNHSWSQIAELKGSCIRGTEI